MILLAMVDITLHREITRQREALLAESESANRSKDDFIAMLSHELRAPLAAVMGWTHLITSGKLAPEEVTKAMRVIDRNTRLQARLIEDLLDISRISAGSIQMEPVSVDLDLLVNSAIDAVSLAAEETKTRIIVSIGAAVPKILGDRDRLDQVVRNLLSNSRRRSWHPRRSAAASLRALLPGELRKREARRAWARACARTPHRGSPRWIGRGPQCWGREGDLDSGRPSV